MSTQSLGTLLGRNITTQEEVTLSPYGRGLGTYVIGLTGTGKTTLLLSVILEDIASGDGIAIFDPHGDLTEDILLSIPPERENDVILFEPFDTDRPFGLNLFECSNTKDANLVDRISSEVMGTFYKLFGELSWGPQMEDLLRVSTLSLIFNQDIEPVWMRPTMAEMPLIWTRWDYRAPIVDHLPKGAVKDFWNQTYEPLGVKKNGKPTFQMLEYHRSSINKVRRFLLNTTIRNIVGQSVSSFNFRQIMDEGKILLCNLSKGKLGEDNSALLGSVLVGKILIAALSRANVPFEKRRPFHLVVDEFQSFATSSFPTFQAEARKFRIDTIVAHQYRQQLDELNRGSTLTVGNKIIFRVSGVDAVVLAKEFDNTPPPPDRTMQPLYKEQGKLPSGELLYMQPSSPIGVGSLYREVELPRRSYSDVEGEKANQLTTLAQFTASAKIVLETGALKEYTFKPTRPTISDVPQARARAERIRSESRRKFGRDREQVEEEILKRQGQIEAEEVGAEPIYYDE
jgi:hypothetical protein